MTLDSAASIADGLMTIRPGDLTFEHVRAFVDEVVTVSDDDDDPRDRAGSIATRGSSSSRAAR